jgi:hypothetical protein
MKASMADRKSAAEPGDDDLRADVARGVAYLHGRVNATAGRAFDAASFVYALVEVLAEKNLLTVVEVDERKKAVAGRLLEKFARHDHGVSLQESGIDKYDSQQAVAIDCGGRVHLCRAACCKMVFPLSQQDIEEGVIKWDLGAPYVIAKDADGYCRHFDRDRTGCSEHARRPVPCRVYDCRNDKRIWSDFTAMIINPKLHAPDWPHNLAKEEAAMDATV